MQVFGCQMNEEEGTRMRGILEDAGAVETDSPDMAPAFCPHQRNSPQNLPQICEAIARLRGESAEQLARQCLHNTCELFDWPLAALS